MKTILCEKPFISIQGEGPYIGIPAVFVRFSGCNLSCPGCDTKYHKDGFKTTTEEIIKQIKELNPLTKSIVFTGGEPLLKQAEIIEIIKGLGPQFKAWGGKISYQHWWFQIETNGTINPEKINKEISKSAVVFNISPKLSTFNQKGAKIELFKNWFLTSSYILKFVVSSEEDIPEIIKISNDLFTGPQDIYLMPEGDTKEKQEEKMKLIINLAIKHGLNFTPRLHILIWGKRRGI